MKNIILMISLLISLNSFAYENIVDSKWDNLLSYNNGIIFSSISSKLKLLQGEIITIKLKEHSYLNKRLQCFMNLIPDTVWINKPKKNPKINKDYTIMPYYHGEGYYDEKAYYDNDKRYTPENYVNNVTFFVDSVCVTSYEPCYIYLTNVTNNERLIWAFKKDTGYDITVMSQSLGEKIMPPQTVLYKSNSSSYSDPKLKDVKPCRVTKSMWEATFDSYSFSPKLSIYISSESGETEIYKYDKSDYSRTYITPKYLAIVDYENLVEEEKDFELNTITDLTAIKYDFPFSFRTIWGLTNSSSIVYQKKCGKSSYSDIKGYMDKDTHIRIAGKQAIHGKDYYIATCYGKCFYIPVSDVTMEDEDKAKLDSLMSSTKEVQEKFFEVTKGFELYQYSQDMKKILNEFDSFKKYGLSVVEWRVYDESEYTDGTGIRFTFYNPTSSMIKYITITFVGYNAVDDPVGRAITKKCIGPIEPDESADYEFEYTWFTDIVEYAKIRSIKVDYKNGTSKTITNVSKIEWSDDLYDFFKNPPLKDLTTLSVPEQKE